MYERNNEYNMSGQRRGRGRGRGAFCPPFLDTQNSFQNERFRNPNQMNYSRFPSANTSYNFRNPRSSYNWSSNRGSFSWANNNVNRFPSLFNLPPRRPPFSQQRHSLAEQNNRSLSPLPGSDEARQRTIAEASARIKEQLNIFEPNSSYSFDKIPNLSKVTLNKPTYFERIPQLPPERISKTVQNINETPRPPETKKRARKNNPPKNSVSVQELRNKIITQFTTMSKGKIQNLVNNPGSTKYDAALQHLVRDMRLNLSSELRNIYSNKTNPNESESIIDHFNTLVPDLGVEIANLPDTLVNELSNILQMDINILNDDGNQTLDNSSETGENEITMIEPELFFQQAQQMLTNSVVNFHEDAAELTNVNYIDFTRPPPSFTSENNPSNELVSSTRNIDNSQLSLRQNMNLHEVPNIERISSTQQLNDFQPNQFNVYNSFNIENNEMPGQPSYQDLIPRSNIPVLSNVYTREVGSLPIPNKIETTESYNQQIFQPQNPCTSELNDNQQILNFENETNVINNTTTQNFQDVNETNLNYGTNKSNMKIQFIFKDLNKVVPKTTCLDIFDVPEEIKNKINIENKVIESTVEIKPMENKSLLKQTKSTNNSNKTAELTKNEISAEVIKSISEATIPPEKLYIDKITSNKEGYNIFDIELPKENKTSDKQSKLIEKDKVRTSDENLDNPKKLSDNQVQMNKRLQDLRTQITSEDMESPINDNDQTEVLSPDSEDYDSDTWKEYDESDHEIKSRSHSSESRVKNRSKSVEKYERIENKYKRNRRNKESNATFSDRRRETIRFNSINPYKRVTERYNKGKYYYQEKSEFMSASRNKYNDKYTHERQYELNLRHPSTSERYRDETKCVPDDYESRLEDYREQQKQRYHRRISPRHISPSESENSDKSSDSKAAGPVSLVDNELPKHIIPLEKRLKALKDIQKESSKNDHENDADDCIIIDDYENELLAEVEELSPNKHKNTIIDDREKEIIGRNASPPNTHIRDKNEKIVRKVSPFTKDVKNKSSKVIRNNSPLDINIQSKKENMIRNKSPPSTVISSRKDGDIKKRYLLSKINDLICDIKNSKPQQKKKENLKTSTITKVPEKLKIIQEDIKIENTIPLYISSNRARTNNFFRQELLNFNLSQESFSGSSKASNTGNNAEGEKAVLEQKSVTSPKYSFKNDQSKFSNKDRSIMLDFCVDKGSKNMNLPKPEDDKNINKIVEKQNEKRDIEIIDLTDSIDTQIEEKIIKASTLVPTNKTQFPAIAITQNSNKGTCNASIFKPSNDKNQKIIDVDMSQNPTTSKIENKVNIKNQKSTKYETEKAQKGEFQKADKYVIKPQDLFSGLTIDTIGKNNVKTKKYNLSTNKQLTKENIDKENTKEILETTEKFTNKNTEESTKKVIIENIAKQKPQEITELEPVVDSSSSHNSVQDSNQKQNPQKIRLKRSLAINQSTTQNKIEQNTNYDISLSENKNTKEEINQQKQIDTRICDTTIDNQKLTLSLNNEGTTSAENNINNDFIKIKVQNSNVQTDKSENRTSTTVNEKILIENLQPTQKSNKTNSEILKSFSKEYNIPFNKSLQINIVRLKSSEIEEAIGPKLFDAENNIIAGNKSESETSIKNHKNDNNPNINIDKTELLIVNNINQSKSLSEIKAENLDSSIVLNEANKNIDENNTNNLLNQNTSINVSPNNSVKQQITDTKMSKNDIVNTKPKNVTINTQTSDENINTIDTHAIESKSKKTLENKYIEDSTNTTINSSNIINSTQMIVDIVEQNSQNVNKKLVESIALPSKMQKEPYSVDINKPEKPDNSSKTNKTLKLIKSTITDKTDEKLKLVEATVAVPPLKINEESTSIDIDKVEKKDKKLKLVEAKVAVPPLKINEEPPSVDVNKVEKTDKKLKLVEGIVTVSRLKINEEPPLVDINKIEKTEKKLKLIASTISVQPLNISKPSIDIDKVKKTVKKSKLVEPTVPVAPLKINEEPPLIEIDRVEKKDKNEIKTNKKLKAVQQIIAVQLLKINEEQPSIDIDRVEKTENNAKTNQKLKLNESATVQPIKINEERPSVDINKVEKTDNHAIKTEQKLKIVESTITVQPLKSDDKPPSVDIDRVEKTNLVESTVTIPPLKNSESTSVFIDKVEQTDPSDSNNTISTTKSNLNEIIKNEMVKNTSESKDHRKRTEKNLTKENKSEKKHSSESFDKSKDRKRSSSKDRRHRSKEKDKKSQERSDDRTKGGKNEKDNKEKTSQTHKKSEESNDKYSKGETHKSKDKIRHQSKSSEKRLHTETLKSKSIPNEKESSHIKENKRSSRKSDKKEKTIKSIAYKTITKAKDKITTNSDNNSGSKKDKKASKEKPLSLLTSFKDNKLASDAHDKLNNKIKKSDTEKTSTKPIITECESSDNSADAFYGFSPQRTQIKRKLDQHIENLTKKTKFEITENLYEDFKKKTVNQNKESSSKKRASSTEGRKSMSRERSIEKRLPTNRKSKHSDINKTLEIQISPSISLESNLRSETTNLSPTTSERTIKTPIPCNISPTKQKPKRKEIILHRMMSIDLEIQKLMQEKWDLYKELQLMNKNQEFTNQHLMNMPMNILNTMPSTSNYLQNNSTPQDHNKTTNNVPLLMKVTDVDKETTNVKQYLKDNASEKIKKSTISSKSIDDNNEQSHNELTATVFTLLDNLQTSLSPALEQGVDSNQSEKLTTDKYETKLNININKNTVETEPILETIRKYCPVLLNNDGSSEIDSIEKVSANNKIIENIKKEYISESDETEKEKPIENKFNDNIKPKIETKKVLRKTSQKSQTTKMKKGSKKLVYDTNESDDKSRIKILNENTDILKRNPSEESLLRNMELQQTKILEIIGVSKPYHHNQSSTSESEIDDTLTNRRKRKKTRKRKEKHNTNKKRKTNSSKTNMRRKNIVSSDSESEGDQLVTPIKIITSDKVPKILKGNKTKKRRIEKNSDIDVDRNLEPKSLRSKTQSATQLETHAASSSNESITDEKCTTPDLIKDYEPSLPKSNKKDIQEHIYFSITDKKYTSPNRISDCESRSKSLRSRKQKVKQETHIVKQSDKNLVILKEKSFTDFASDSETPTKSLRSKKRNIIQSDAELDSSKDNLPSTINKPALIQNKTNKSKSTTKPLRKKKNNFIVITDVPDDINDDKPPTPDITTKENESTMKTLELNQSLVSEVQLVMEEFKSVDCSTTNELVSPSTSQKSQNVLYMKESSEIVEICVTPEASTDQESK